jgi:hypothetical protein
MQEEEPESFRKYLKAAIGPVGAVGVTLWVLSTYPIEGTLWRHLSYSLLIPMAWLLAGVQWAWRNWAGISRKWHIASVVASIVLCVGIIYSVFHFWPTPQTEAEIEPKQESPSAPTPEPQAQQHPSDPKPNTNTPNTPKAPAAKLTEPPTGNPIIDLAIGEIFKNPTVIIVKNAAPGPAMNAYINLRCILLDSTREPIAFTSGFDSIDNKNVWWQIGKITSDMKPLVKDFKSFAVSCLENKENMEKFSQPGNQPFNFGETILVADMTFQSGKEMTRSNETRIATLGYSAGTNLITTYPLALSDRYKAILEKAKATSFR